jgi:hypothetical protein
MKDRPKRATLLLEFSTIHMDPYQEYQKVPKNEA